MTSTALTTIHNVYEAAATINSEALGITVVAGLGLPGQLLLRATAATADVQSYLGNLGYLTYFGSNSAVQLQATPNDTSYAQLYGMHNTGQTGGTPDADIDAPEAWNISTGSSSIVVGVIDTGIDWTHPDLAANIWTNPGELAGDGIDNDANGFVDDVHGYDFVNNDGNPMDDHYHGTHVVGTIGGAGNNNQGIVGVNWNVSMMGLKFLSSSGSGTTANAIRAVNYATMMKSTYGVNVRVTSNSWGGGGFDQGLLDAINAGGAANILFVAAAGNDGLNSDLTTNYPSGYNSQYIVSVAATDHNDALAYFSNYGATSVDLAAPGVNTYSTAPNNSYQSLSGTSMATPHVSGVAALALSVNPTLTALQLKNALLNNVDVIPSLTGKTVTGGRLNAYKVLNSLGLTVAATTPAAGAVVSTPPTSFLVDFSNPYTPATVAAGDFTVNGIAADSFTLTDADTVTFAFNTSPVSAQGPQTMTLAAGAITRLSDGDALEAYSGTFRYDALAMTVAATTPTNGSLVSLPFTTLDVQFNEDYAPGSIGTSDLTLSRGTVTAATALNATTVRYTLSGITTTLPLTFSLAAGAVTDVYGNPNSAYSGNLLLDEGTMPFSAPLTAVEPRGGLVYRGSSTGDIGFAGDDDRFTLTLDAGQLLSLVVSSSTTLTAIVELRDESNLLLGTATAGAAGKDGVLQGMPILTAGVYTIIVRGAANTIGNYTVKATLNAAVENENAGGASNSTPATAQNLDSAFLSLGGTAYRAAVLGAIQAPTAPVVLNAADSGWWDQTGYHDSSNTNYLVGRSDLGELYRDFFVFDLSSITQSVTAAELRITNPSGGYASPDAGEDYAVYDVSTAIATLTGSGSGQTSIYSDLGTGLQYASQTVTSASSGQVVTVSLNADALSYLNASRGGLAAVGGALTTISGTSAQYVFGFSGSSYSRQLALTLAPPDNVDYYSFTLTAGEVVTVSTSSIGAGSSSLQLYDAAGNLITSGVSNALGSGQEILYAVATGGTYYARVTATTGVDYNLVVGRNAQLAGGANTSTAAAQSLVGTSGTVTGSISGTIGLGRLYMYDATAGMIREINPTTGAILNSFASPVTTSSGPDFGAATTSTSLLVGGIGSSPIYELNPSTGAVLRTIPNPNIDISGLAFRNGEIFVRTDSNNTITVINYATGAVARTFTITSSTESLAAASDYLYAINGSTLYSIDPQTGATVATRTLSASSGPEGLGVIEDELFVGGISSIAVYDRQTLALKRTLTGLNDLEAIGADGGNSAASQYYRLALTAGAPFQAVTSTPADDVGEFVNAFDPLLELYDATGALLASNDNGADDGRNAVLNYTPVAGGTYYLRVAASASSTSQSRQGDYVLSYSGNAPTTAAFNVASTTPPADTVVHDLLNSLTVNFNQPADLASISAADLTINGVAATGVTIVDNDTVVFSFAPPARGNVTFNFAAGAIRDLLGTPVAAFSAQVNYQLNAAPTLTGTPAPVFVTMLEDPVTNVGMLISELLATGAGGNPISDTDATDPQGIAVTAAATSTGSWQYSLNNGGSWSALGTVSTTSARLLASDVQTRIRYVPTANSFGTISSALTFRAWDQTSGANGGTANVTSNGGTTAFSTATATASLTVTAVNDAPSFTKGANQNVGSFGTVRTVTSWATSITAGSSESSQTLTFLVSNNNNALFDVQPTISSTGTLTFTPKLNALGTATVTVQLQDNGGTGNGGVDLSAVQTFTITVAPPPFVNGFTTQTINEDGQVTVPFTITDADTPLTSLSITPYSSNTTLVPTSGIVIENLGGGSYRLVVTPVVNVSGTAQVGVVVADGTTTATTAFTLNVNSVNDAPTFTKGSNLTATFPGPYTLSNWATGISAGPNESSQTLTFSVSVDDPSLFSVAPTISSNGTLTFTPGAGKSGTATVTVQLTDNGGTVNGGVDVSAPQTFTILVNTPTTARGMLDPTFGTGGVTKHALTTSNDQANDVVVLSDGKIIVVGSGNPAGASPLARYNSNGTLDTSFGNGGLAASAGTNLTFAAVQVQADGKILAAGYNSSSAAVLVRFNADGSVDTGFGTNGVVTFASASFNDLAVLSDQKIVVFGSRSSTDVLVARYTSTGSLDTTFGTGGSTIVDRAPVFGIGGLRAAIQSDGKLLLTSYSSYDYSGFEVYRFNANGTLDTTWSGDGYLNIAPSGTTDGRATDVLVQGDGKIVLVGFSGEYSYDQTNLALMRLNVDGSLDATFGTGGKSTFNLGVNYDGAWSASLLPDGKIVVGGFAYGASPTKSLLAVVNANGTLDTTFGANGFVLPGFGTGTESINRVAVLPDGNIVAVGYVTPATTTDFIVAKFIVAGTAADAPTIDPISTQLLTEDGAPVVVDITVADPNNAAGSLLVTASISDSTLLTGGVVLANLGNGHWQATLTPAANRFGSADVTLSVYDALGFSSWRTFTVIVGAVNDVPSFTKGANQLVSAASGPQSTANWATSISPGPNETGQTLSFIVTNDNNGLFSIQPTISANGTLTYTPSGVIGTAVVTVQLRDDGGTAAGGIDTSPSQTFTITVNPLPRIVGSSLQQGDVIAPGNLTYVVTFSQAMLKANLDASDFSLTGLDRSTTYAATSFSYDASGTNLTLNFANLPEDRYVLTLLSGNGRFEDANGLDLDGEAVTWPIPPNNSGDGAPGGNFVVNFTVDVTSAPFSAPFVAVGQPGGLVYQSSSATPLTVSLASGDTDDVTLALDAGQTLALLVTPAAGLQVSVSVLDPDGTTIGTYTSSAAGAKLAVLPIQISTAGTYTLRFTGAGNTVGSATVVATLNAALDQDTYGGSTNSTISTAQDLDSVFTSPTTGGLRAAILGTVTNSPLDVAVESFETGTLGGTWSTYSSTVNGRIQLTSADGTHAGAFAMYMDTTSGTTLNEAVWTVNLTGLTSATLNFWHSEQGDEETAYNGAFTGHYNADGVAISANGTNWFPIWNAADQSAGAWTKYSFDLVVAAASAGISLNSAFKIKFQQVDDNPLTSDGRAWDDISITTPAPPDEDWYSFTLAAGDSASISAATISGGSATVRLVDATGTTLAWPVSAGNGTSLDVSDFTAAAGGTYYAVVTPLSNVDYSLVVTKNLGFDDRNGGTISSAQILNSDHGTVLGTVASSTELGRLFIYDASSTRLIRELNPTTGAVLRSFSAPAPTFSLSIGLATTRNTLLYGNGDGSLIYELNPDTGAVIRTIANAGGTITGLAYRDGEIFVQNSSTSVTVLDYATGNIRRTLTVASISELAAGKDYLYGASGTTLRVLNPLTGATVSSQSLSGSSGSGIGVIGNELFVTNNSGGVSAFDLQTFALSRAFTGSSFLYAIGADGSDRQANYYRVTLSEGALFHASTSTPGDATGEFVNQFDPLLQLYDAQGVLVTSDDNSGTDGRNASLTYNVTANGTYYVKVSAADLNNLQTSHGEYVLHYDGAQATSSFSVASITPADGAMFITPPTQVTVRFGEQFLATSLTADDLTIDGVAATSLTIVDGSTVVFTLPGVPTEGVHQLAIATGAILDLQGTPIAGFSSQFSVDHTAPRIVSSSLQQNDVRSSGSLTYVVTFNERMLTSNLSSFDYTLHADLHNLDYLATSASFDATGTILTLVYNNLPEDSYSLTLWSGHTQFEDPFGNVLDGEAVFPLPPNSSGNGTAGGNFVVSFFLDASTSAFPTPLAADVLAGSLVYASSSSTPYTVYLSFAGDTDDVTLALEAGQTLAAVITSSTALQVQCTLFDPNDNVVGTYTAAAVGGKIALNSVPITTAGVYRLRFAGVGGTVGSASVVLTLNAALESESNDGSSNNSTATAQNLDGAFSALGPTASRAAVVGTSDAIFASLTAEVESNNSTAAANNAAGNFTAAPANLYHLVLRGSANWNDEDFFKIGTLQAGDIITIVQSGSPSTRGTATDSNVALYRGSSGTTFVTSNDDNGPGSDSLIYRYTITTADTYYIRATQDVSTTGTYELGVYLENTGTTPLTGGTFIDEVESNGYGSANDASSSWRAVQYLSSTTASISSGDVDVYGYYFQAGDLVTVLADSTSSLDARVSLLNAAGTTVAAEDGTSTGPSPDSYLYAYRIPTTGVYYVQVSSSGSSTGNYTAKVYLSAATAPPAPAAAADYYSFTLTAGQSTSLAIARQAAGSSLQLKLTDALGNTVATGNASGSLDSAIDAFVAPTTGTYYAVVTSPFGSVGYDLVVTRGASFDVANHSTAATAQSINGSRSVLGYVNLTASDWYSVQVAATTTLSISTVTPGDAAGEFINTLNPALALFDNAGQFLAGNGDGAADARNAQLHYVVGPGTYKIQVSATAGAGEYLLSVAEGTGPGISSLNDTTIYEGGSATINFAVSDPDTPVDQLVITATASNSTLVPAENLNLSNLGGGNWRITATPPADQFGSSLISVNVGDGVTTHSTAMTFTVTGINDVPSFTKGGDQTAVNNGGTQTAANWATGISAGPFETQTLTFQVSNDNTALFTVQPTISASGTLTYTPSGVLGTAVVTVRLKDNGGTASGGIDLSDPQTFQIQINNSTSSTPSIAAIIDQSTNEDVPLTLDVTVGHTTLPLTALTLSASSSNATVFPSGSFTFTDLGGGVWRMTATPAANQYGASLVTVFVGDGAVSAATTFDLYVVAVNDAPSFTLGPNRVHSGYSGDQVVTNFATAIGKGPNETSQSVTFAVSNDNPSLFAVQPTISSTGTLSYTPSGIGGTANVVVVLTDNGGTALGGSDTSAAQTFKIDFTGGVQSTGSLDKSFDGDGMSAFQSTYGAIDNGREVVRQNDGKYVVLGRVGTSGDGSILVRFNADGSLDTSFGSSGAVRFQSSIYLNAVKLQGDGKILVAGMSSTSTYVARFNSDGSVDSTFGVNGSRTVVVANLSYSSSYLGSMTLQADGKIVVANTHRASGTSSYSDAILVRFTADGTLDTSFNGVGYRVFSIVSTGQDAPADVAVQADGKIVLVGTAATSSSSSTNDFYAARFTVDGLLDTTFGGGAGYVTVNVGTSATSSDVARRVSIQADGKIVIAGAAGSDFAVIRLLADGSLDTSLDADGKLVTNIASSEAALALLTQSDEKILIGGYIGSGSTQDLQLLRYNGDGTLDATFDGDGKRTVAIGIGGDQAYGLIADASGKFTAVGGAVFNGTGTDIVLARFNADGGLDTTFDGDGIAAYNSGRSSQQAKKTLVLSDGRILVGGNVSVPSTSLGSNSTRSAIWRLLADGTIDTTFGSGGYFVGTNLVDVGHLAVRPSDGKILFTADGSTIGRLNSDGTLDTTFGTAGYLSVSYSAADIEFQADGKMLVSGYDSITTTDFSLTRYNSDGTVDATFAGDGQVTVDVLGNTDYGYHLAVQADGKIVVGGRVYSGSSYQFGVVQFNDDGTLDTTFSDDGMLVATPLGAGTMTVNDLLLQADGKIVVAGYANFSTTSYDFVVLRITTDGTPDTTFGASGFVVTPISTSSDFLSEIETTSDGKLVAVGYSNTTTSYGIAVVRYLSDGTLDASFDGDGILTTDVDSSTDYAFGSALQADGKLIVAGFTTASGALTPTTYDAVVLRYWMTDGPTPSITAINDVATTDGDATAASSFTVGHSSLPVSSLAVTATSSNTSLIPDTGLTLTNLGNGQWTITATPVGEATGTSRITVFVSDGVSTFAESFVVTVVSANDAPRHQTPSAQMVHVGSNLRFSTSDGNAISVSDSDAGSAAIQTTLTAVGGKLTLAGTSGLTFSTGDGTADAAMTFTGTITAINAALDGMVFSPDAGFSGAGSLRIQTDDLGATGGASQQDDDTIAINVNVAPTVAGVYARGTSWTAGLLNYLANNNMGYATDASLGYRLSLGANQLKTLPWTNVNQVSIRFSEAVNVSQGSLTVVGASNGAAVPSISGFSWSTANNVATWTFAAALPRGKFLLHLDGAVVDANGAALDGEWTVTSSTTSGNGLKGGDFNFRFNVLPGDIDGNNTVGNPEILQARFDAGKGTASTGYNLRKDLDANGTIGNPEILSARTRAGTSVTGLNEPVAPGSSPQTALVTADPPTDENGDFLASWTPLTMPELLPLVAEAKRRWEASGLVDAPDWSRLHLTVMNLGGYLGMTDSDGLVRIDDDGAGMNWFIDATPSDDVEFTPTSDVEFTASPDIAADRYDLLTTIMHELGNYLGFHDVSASRPPEMLMTENIGTGVRRIPAPVVEAPAVGGELSLASGEPVREESDRKVESSATTDVNEFAISNLFASSDVPLKPTASEATEPQISANLIAWPTEVFVVSTDIAEPLLMRPSLRDAANYEFSLPNQAETTTSGDFVGATAFEESEPMLRPAMWSSTASPPTERSANVGVRQAALASWSATRLRDAPSNSLAAATLTPATPNVVFGDPEPDTGLLTSDVPSSAPSKQVAVGVASNSGAKLRRLLTDEAFALWRDRANEFRIRPDAVRASIETT